jgi:hypothetical protein
MSQLETINSRARDTTAEIKLPLPEDTGFTSQPSSLFDAEDATTRNSDISVSKFDETRDAVAASGKFEPQPLQVLSPKSSFL